MMRHSNFTAVVPANDNWRRGGQGDLFILCHDRGDGLEVDVIGKVEHGTTIILGIVERELPRGAA